MKKVTIVLVIALFLGGCATRIFTKREDLLRQAVERHPEWTEQEKNNVLEGTLRIGMTKEQAIVAHEHSCYLDPTEVRKTTTAFGTREDWFWFNVHGGLILHMSFDENGRLDYWSEN